MNLELLETGTFKRDLQGKLGEFSGSSTKKSLAYEALRMSFFKYHSGSSLSFHSKNIG